MIEIFGLRRKFHSSSFELHIDRLSLPSKGLVFLTGKSGSGKTTLLNLMGLLDSPDSGEIIWNGRNLSQCSFRKIDKIRKSSVSVLSEHFDLINDLTVLENLTVFGISRERALFCLNLVGINDLSADTALLSDGEKQRVAVARSLAREASVYLIDEPSANLDRTNAEKIFQELKRLSRNALVITVSHDQSFTENYADRTITLDNGKIVSDVGLLINTDYERPERPSTTLKMGKLTNYFKRKTRKFGGRTTLFIVLTAFLTAVTALLSSFFNYEYRQSMADFSLANNIPTVGLNIYESGGIRNYFYGDGLPDKFKNNTFPAEPISFINRYTHQRLETKLLIASERQSFKLNGVEYRAPSSETILLSSFVVDFINYAPEDTKVQTIRTVDCLGESFKVSVMTDSHRAEDIEVLFDEDEHETKVKNIGLTYAYAVIDSSAYRRILKKETVTATFSGAKTEAGESLKDEICYLSSDLDNVTELDGCDQEFISRGYLAADEVILSEGYALELSKIYGPIEVGRVYKFISSADDGVGGNYYRMTDAFSGFKVVGITEASDLSFDFLVSESVMDLICTQYAYQCSDLLLNVNSETSGFIDHFPAIFLGYDEFGLVSGQENLFDLRTPNTFRNFFRSKKVSAAILVFLVILGLMTAISALLTCSFTLKKFESDFTVFRSYGLGLGQALKPILLIDLMGLLLVFGFSLAFSAGGLALTDFIVSLIEKSRSGLKVSVIDIGSLRLWLPTLIAVGFYLFRAAFGIFRLARINLSGKMQESRTL